MNIITIKSAFVLAVAFVATLLVQITLTMPAHAVARTWDGGGVDNNFSTAANWDSDTLPVSGDTIYLNTTGMTGGTFNADLNTETGNVSAFESITLSGTGSGTFTLTGTDSIRLTGSAPKLLEGGLLNNGDQYNNQNFNVEVNLTLTANMNFRAGANLTIGAADGSNTLDLGTFTMTKTGEAPLTINSVISGAGGVTISNGWFVADDTNTFTGGITVGNGGTLKGTGTVGDVTVSSGGTVAPGLSPGCLSTGNIAFTSGSTYTVEIDGATVCTQYDQTRVTGTVSLGDATLNIVRLASYTPADATLFMIIDNDGTADAVTGTFNGLAEGATTTIDGVVYTVSYVGGDGNDVVLSATAVAAPDTGFGSVTINYLLVALVTVAATAGIVVAGRKLQKAKN